MPAGKKKEGVERGKSGTVYKKKRFSDLCGFRWVCDGHDGYQAFPMLWSVSGGRVESERLGDTDPRQMERDESVYDDPRDQPF